MDEAVDRRAEPWWDASEGARARLEDLLVSSGAPFEASIAADCQRFENVFDEPDLTISAQRLTYSEPRGDAPLREVDQCVTLYQEIEVGSCLGIQLIIQAVVECKHRHGLNAFGFPEPSSSRRPLIATGALTFSGAIRQSLGDFPADLEGAVNTIALTVDPSLSGKHRVLDERLIHNAAMALLDFVDADVERDDAAEAQAILQEIGAVAAFDSYTSERGYYPPSVVGAWSESTVEDYAKAFVDRLHRRGRVYHLLSLYVPIVCLDGGLHEVTIDHTGVIESITPVDRLLVGVRPPGWPHRLHPFAPTIGGEATAVVVDRAGLSRTLVQLHKWAVDLRRRLERIDDVAATALLYESFLRSVVTRQHADGTVHRSDLEPWS